MFFSELKAKQKSTLTEWSFKNYLASYVVGMFDWNIPTESYATRYLDLLLLTEGKAALFRSKYYNNEWVVGKASFTGQGLDPYGVLPDVEVFDQGGHSIKFKNWKENKDCYIFFNDKSHNPDITIERYADLMAKIDISLNANIVNSRMSPIVVAKDSTTANQIKEILKQNHDGATEVITSPGILNDNDDITVLNITDVNASDKIQYLSHAHDDLLRRFLNIYGLHINGTGKMAQQSIEEINGDQNAALVIPNEMLEARKEVLERFKRDTGIDVSIKFNRAWEREVIEADAETDISEAEADISEAEADISEAEAEQGADNAADDVKQSADEVSGDESSDEKQEQGE